MGLTRTYAGHPRDRIPLERRAGEQSLEAHWSEKLGSVVAGAALVPFEPM